MAYCVGIHQVGIHQIQLTDLAPLFHSSCVTGPYLDFGLWRPSHGFPEAESFAKTSIQEDVLTLLLTAAVGANIFG